MSNMLERLWRFGVSTGALEGQEFWPAIELREEPEGYVLYAEVPGLSLALIEVTAGPSSVTIAGDKVKQVAPGAEGEPGYPRVLTDERRYGRFTRTINLPGSIRTEAISATLADGVLTLELPKVAAPKPVEIRVEVSKPAAGASPPPTGPSTI
jgi:HSP20 family protein